MQSAICHAISVSSLRWRNSRLTYLPSLNIFASVLRYAEDEPVNILLKFIVESSRLFAKCRLEPRDIGPYVIG